MGKCVASSFMSVSDSELIFVEVFTNQSSMPPTPKFCTQHISLTALLWIKSNYSLHNTNNIPFCPEDTSQQMQTKPQTTTDKSTSNQL